MNIQPVVENDINSIQHLQPEGWKDITFFFKKYINQPFSHPIKVTIDSVIVGIGTCIIHQDQAWLGHIIVDTRMRNKGIGKSITKHLINIANKHQCGSIHLIATALGYPVYTSLGFKDFTEYIFFQKSNEISFFEIDNRIQPYSNTFLDEIFALDKSISGEDRQAEIIEYLDLGYYFINHNEVIGFYLPDFGEGLIIARDNIAGIELLKLHINTHDYVSIPKENTYASKFLLDYNFIEINRAKRLIIGEGNNIKLNCIFNRIAGNLG